MNRSITAIMRTSFIRRIEQLEQRQLPLKPFLILQDGEPRPEDAADFNIIQIRTIDLTNYLKPDTPRLPFCPV